MQFMILPQGKIIRSVFFAQLKQHSCLKNVRLVDSGNYHFAVSYDQLSPEK